MKINSVPLVYFRDAYHPVSAAMKHLQHNCTILWSYLLTACVFSFLKKGSCSPHTHAIVRTDHILIFEFLNTTTSTPHSSKGWKDYRFLTLQLPDPLTVLFVQLLPSLCQSKLVWLTKTHFICLSYPTHSQHASKPGWGHVILGKGAIKGR